jgi:hypothetical protein
MHMQLEPALNGVIFKYPLFDMRAPEDFRTLDLPEVLHPLHVGMQNEVLCLWAAVDPTSATIKRTFAIVGTGWPLVRHLGNNARYIGTVHDKPFVWHVFEKATWRDA